MRRKMEFRDLEIDGRFVFELKFFGHGLVASPEIFVPLAGDVV